MGGRFGIWWRITMHQTGRSQKRTNKWFAGSPFGNPKKFAGFGNSVLFFGNAKGNPKKFAGFRNSVLFFRKKSQANSVLFFRTSKRNARKNSGTANKNFPKFASKFGNKLVTKRVAKDIDPTRVKRIELTNKEKIRNRLETQAYFPQQSTGFLSVLRKTILDYFLPFPPAPPLDDKRNALPDHRKNKKGSQR